MHVDADRSPNPVIPQTLAIAFKEWAVVCDRILSGEQTIIFRKGGIHEVEGGFRPEHEWFWLFPTYFHQPQRDGLKSSALPRLEIMLANAPAPDKVGLHGLVRVKEARFISNLDEALKLDAQHCWSEATVRQRFHYRTPGLYVLEVQAYRLSESVEIDSRAEYDGCKTWVPLAESISTAGAIRVTEQKASHE